LFLTRDRSEKGWQKQISHEIVDSADYEKINRTFFCCQIFSFYMLIELVALVLFYWKDFTLKMGLLKKGKSDALGFAHWAFD